MALFDKSVDLERSVLKSLLTDISSCRLYVFRVKEEFFSSEARRFLLQEIVKEFNLSQALVPEDILENSILMKHNSDKVMFIGEKNIILGSKPSTNMEASIRALHETWVGRKTLECVEEVSALLSEGKFLEAATEFRQKAFSISTTEDSKQVKELFSTIKERINKIKDKRDNPEKYKGLKTGIPTLDDKTGGLFPGELTLIAGVTGLGKSTIIKQIEFGILINNHGKNVLHIANEEYEDQVNSKFDALLTGMDYLDFKFAKENIMTDEVIENWEKILGDIQKKCGGRLYTREVPAFTDVTVIRRIFHELKSQGIKIDAILIDHLPNMKPVQKAFGENNEKEKITEEVKELARELRVPIVIATQAATQVEEKQMKGKRASKLDVYGSKAQIHHANMFFIITFLGRDHKMKKDSKTGKDLPDYLKDVFLLLDVKKNRDGPCFTVKIRHQVKSGRMTEIEIDPELQKRIDEEHANALKTGDFSTTVITESVEDDSVITNKKGNSEELMTREQMELKELESLNSGG